MDDATLDEFGDAEADDREEDSGAGGDDGAATGGVDATPTDDSETTAAPEPAVTTYAWAPDGAACAVCGDTAAARWRREVGFVCGDCLDWEG